MENEQRASSPSWSRWAPLVRTSPSGKTLFVCLVCGVTSPNQPKECNGNRKEWDEHFDPRLKAYLGNNITCETVERFINYRIENHLPDHLKLDWAENRLNTADRNCAYCHGYGCQYCLGSGKMHR